MHTTPRLALRLPDGTGDAPDVPLWMERLALDLESSLSVGLASARPAAGKAGRRYFATDTKVDAVDTGATWEPVGQIADGAVTAAKLAAAVKPSGGAAAGTEALRAIGSAAGQVLAGNDVTVPQYVTSLPTSPADGQEIYYRPAAGVIWHLRYNAGSGSSYKWEAVGGQAPLFQENPGIGYVYVSSGWVALDGPSIVLPAGVGGDFLVTIGTAAYMVPDAYNYPAGAMSFAVNGTQSARWIAMTNGGANSQLWNTASQEFLHTGMAAGATVAARYSVAQQSGAANFAIRTLSVRPTRIG